MNFEFILTVYRRESHIILKRIYCTIMFYLVVAQITNVSVTVYMHTICNRHKYNDHQHNLNLHMRQRANTFNVNVGGAIRPNTWKSSSLPELPLWDSPITPQEIFRNPYFCTPPSSRDFNEQDAIDHLSDLSKEDIIPDWALCHNENILETLFDDSLTNQYKPLSLHISLDLGFQRQCMVEVLREMLNVEYWKRLGQDDFGFFEFSDDSSYTEESTLSELDLW